MPVEIRELVIRTVVAEPADPQSSGAPSSAQAQPPLDGIDIDLLVQECVRQVLQVLARERGR